MSKFCPQFDFENTKKMNKEKYLYDVKQILKSARFRDLYPRLVSLMCWKQFFLYVSQGRIRQNTKLWVKNGGELKKKHASLQLRQFHAES